MKLQQQQDSEAMGESNQVNTLSLDAISKKWPHVKLNIVDEYGRPTELPVEYVESIDEMLRTA